MRKFLILLIPFLLLSCSGKDYWARSQFDRCDIMGGQGIYIRHEKLFECFAKNPISITINLNDEIKLKTPEIIKIFEAKYDSKS